MGPNARSACQSPSRLPKSRAPNRRGNTQAAVAHLAARIADERLLLAPQEQQEGPQDHQRQRDWRVENGDAHRVPEHWRQPLKRWLQLREAAFVHDRPGIGDLADIEALTSDGLSAVVDQEDESQGEGQEAEKAEEETDHDRQRRM